MKKRGFNADKRALGMRRATSVLMARKNREPVSDIDRACTNKRNHSTKAIAKAAAKKYRRDTGRRMWVYECQWCGEWHTTTRNRQRGERP